MQDIKYCYPNSNLLKNKLGIHSQKELFEAEKKLTSIRLKELEKSPIDGNFDFEHLKAIHKYIFQDIYIWAGKVRTVEIGKGNLFCTTACIYSYADAIFGKYYPQCIAKKNDKLAFVRLFAENYGDLNALHPFREGNGRAQREFVRLICLKCGYDFSLTATTHAKMLEASILSFNECDNTGFVNIFTEAISPFGKAAESNMPYLKVLTSDDLTIDSYDECVNQYNEPKDLERVEFTQLDE